jgi:hypothetical protein
MISKKAQISNFIKIRLVEAEPFNADILDSFRNFANALGKVFCLIGKPNPVSSAVKSVAWSLQQLAVQPVA